MARGFRKKRKLPPAATKIDGVEPRTPIAPVVEIGWKAVLLRVAVIAAMVVWIYLPVVHGYWLWDDKELIRDSALNHDPAGWWKIWSQPGNLVDFYPLWSTVVWLQWRFWGGDTTGYHLVNILLHLLGALLVWRLLAKFGLRSAWMGGLLFAIHPVQVESVAWISELKNTLSLPPFLLAVCAWIDYDAHHRRRDYFLALGFFIVAMLCKTTMAMFPFVILLHAWWKRGRIQPADLKAGAPFFAVSLVLGIITVWFQNQHAIGGMEIPMGGVESRVALSATSLAFYFAQCICPVGLLPVYPKWSIVPPSPLQMLPWLVLFGLLGACWLKRASWGRHVLLGLGFFVLNLAPFLGFTKAFYMSFSWTVDHNLYLPVIGLAGLAVAGLELAERRLMPAPRAVIAVFAGIVAAAFVTESRDYAKIFLNQEALWTYTLQRNPEAWPGLNNLGNVLLNSGRPGEAMVDFKKALRLHPHDFRIYNNLGNAFFALGQNSKAMDHYRAAIEIDPGYDMAHTNLGIALVRAGRDPEAAAEFKAALAINPHSALAHENLGSLDMRAGHADDAVREFDAVLRDDPHYAEFQTKMQKQKSDSKSSDGN